MEVYDAALSLVILGLVWFAVVSLKLFVLHSCDSWYILLAGVGQSEFAVADMVDMFVLLIPPAGGDELQVSECERLAKSMLIVFNWLNEWHNHSDSYYAAHGVTWSRWSGFGLIIS